MTAAQVSSWSVSEEQCPSSNPWWHVHYHSSPRGARLFACYFSDEGTRCRGFSPGLPALLGESWVGGHCTGRWFCTWPRPQPEVDSELVCMYGLSSIISPSDTGPEVALQFLRNHINPEPVWNVYNCISFSWLSACHIRYCSLALLEKA